MTVPDLTQCNDNPTILDKVAIDNGNGMLMAMFGLGVELYVEPRDRERLRDEMLTVQENYYQLFYEHLDLCSFNSQKDLDGRTVRIAGNPFPMIRSSIGTWPHDRTYANELTGRYVHPDYPHDAGTVTPWESDFLVTAESDKYARLSSYSCYMPLASTKNGLNLRVLLECLVKWCSILNPAHGGAGYSVVLESGSISAEPHTYATLQRYPGLNLIQPVSFSDQARADYNRIKCANWLTVLGDTVVSELGGLEAVRKALEPDCILHTYDGGVVIQAGDVPQLGDTYEGDIPELYRKVARFTKPVRFEAYRSSLFRVFKPMVGAEEAVRWVRRFD